MATTVSAAAAEATGAMAGDGCAPVEDSAAFDTLVFDVSDFFGRSGRIVGNVETLDARERGLPGSGGRARTDAEQGAGGKHRAEHEGGHASGDTC